MGLSELESKITDSVERLSESVVTIRSTKMVREFPLGPMPMQGSGSGFVISDDGKVVSNYHVIDGAEKVEVITKDGKTHVGRVIGGDRATDVVLIRVDEMGLPAANLGDSEKLKVGQAALAIGNSLDLPGGPTVSSGVISALGRPLPWADFIFEGLIQTDAAINPGNSGGPLADSEGNVVGMNTAIVPFAQGVGFAIPINTIKWAIDQISENGRVVRPMLGVSVVTMNQTLARRFGLPITEGVMVAEVSANSPAAKAGLQPGDILERIEGKEIKTIRDLLIAISKLPANQDVSLKFTRQNKRQEVKIKLAEGPIEN